MGIFGLGHRHISPETFTGYLDGRLRPQTRERLDRVMAGCSDCRLEMESLRDTVAMLRQLPVITPRRSFVMSGAPQPVPQMIQQARPISPFRVPQWAYAGAASLAALALAVLVSVDASGLVSPDLPNTAISRQSEKIPTTAESEALTPETAGAKDSTQGETPRQPAEALSIQVESETIVEAPATAEPQAQAAAVAEMQAQVPQAAEPQAEAPAVTELRAQAPRPTELQGAAPAAAEMQAQAPQAAVLQAEAATQKTLESQADQSKVDQSQKVEEPAVTSVLRKQSGRPTTPETTPVQLEQASDAQPEPAEVLPLPTVVSDGATSEPAQVQNQAQTTPITADEQAGPVSPGTPLVWRVLEGVAAVSFLILASVFFLTRRAARRF